MTLSPGQTIIGLYDYSTTTGAKLYIKSTKALNLIDYSVSPQGLQFLNRLSGNAHKPGWNNIETVNGQNIYREHGCFTIAEARIKAQTATWWTWSGSLLPIEPLRKQFNWWNALWHHVITSASTMYTWVENPTWSMITRTAYLSFAFWYQGSWWIISPQ